MTSEDYKLITARWNVKRREVIENALALIESTNGHLAEKLRASIESAPVEKPVEHQGGRHTDYFFVGISKQETQDLVDLLVEQVIAAPPQNEGIKFDHEEYQRQIASRIDRFVDEWSLLNFEG